MTRRQVARRLALAGGVLVAAFLTLFAADVFTEPAGPGGRAVALLMHLLPALLVLAATFAGWRWPLVGGGGVRAAGAGAPRDVRRTGLDWRAYLVIDGALLAMGGLWWIARQRSIASGHGAA